jgi:outer membrane protein assembly factor BamB
MITKRILLLSVFICFHWCLFAQTPGTMKWVFTTGNDVSSSPAIGSDGTIYVGSEDSKLYAINPNGTKKWEFLTGGSIYISSPSVGIDGTIYVGSSDNKVYAINPDGTKKWEFTTGGIIYSSPAVGFNGTVYIGSSDFKLYAINPDGTEKWEFSTGSWVDSSPAIGIDGTVYIGSWDNTLYAVNPDGTKKWEFSADNWIDSSPAIGSDGTIYVGSFDNKIYAINPGGTKKWEFSTAGANSSSPAVGIEGTIYVGSGDGKIYAINPDGTKKWEFLTTGVVSSSPAIGKDGTIFIGSSLNRMYALNPDGTKKWEFSTGLGSYSSPAIGSDGTVYIGCDASYLYAVRSDCGGLAESCWPKFRKNIVNNGSAAAAIYADTRFYAKFTNAASLSFETDFYKIPGKPVIITGIKLSNSNLSAGLSLPYTLNADNTEFFIPLNMSNPHTGLCATAIELQYLYDGVAMTSTDYLDLAVIVDDHTELSVVGKSAVEAYQASLDVNPIAVVNNKGVIYRLLDEPEKAKPLFNTAVSLALGEFYGFTGIKMNQGVVMSDLGYNADAVGYYANTLADLTGVESSSVLAPQVYYNQAWEYYNSESFNDTKTKALQTINHPKANNFLKAKAYVLLGLCDAALEDTATAIDHLQDAVDLDPASCIAEIAKEDICILSTDQYERISICEGESYAGLTESGQYLRKLGSGTGSTSYVITILTVNPKYDIAIDTTICEGQSYNGWTTTGEYVQNLTSSCGCDSTVTTLLTVKDCSSGIEQMQNITFIIYPNPSNGDITIMIPDKSAGSLFIEIQDMTGNIVFSNMLHCTESTCRIHLDHMPAGVYFISVESRGKRTTKKVMIY